METLQISNIQREFEKNGFFIIKNCYSKEETNFVKKYSHEMNNNEVGGVRVIVPDELPQALKEFVCHDQIKENLMEVFSSQIEFLSVKPVYKNSKVSFGTPWHQDWQYWKGESHKISVWVALDNATIENGCLKVIPGSHKNKYEHQSLDGEFGERIKESNLNDEITLDVLMNSGDALFFHDQLVHSSNPNTSSGERWSFISTYRDASLEDKGCALYDTTWQTRLKL
jgi:phytanoyl-CoA hydroxylase